MKCVVVSTLISLAFVSQAFAVLRPPFPAKAAAPFDGELIIIGDDLVADVAETSASVSYPVSVPKPIRPRQALMQRAFLALTNAAM